MSETTGGRPAMPTRTQFKKLNELTTLQELFDHPDFKARIIGAIPKHMSAERLLRTFVTAVAKTPKLNKVNPLSMLGAYITVASLGLEPNTPLGHCYLIPFDEKKWNPATKTRDVMRTNVQLIIGYPGYLDLIFRSGRVKDLHCDVVWKGDDFSYEYGSNAHLRHKPKSQVHDEKEMPLYAYMHARMTDGGEVFEVMTAADVLTIRGRSQGYRTAMYAFDDAQTKGRKLPPSYTEAPWIKDPIPMWRKTALRAGQKWLPKSIEMAVAGALDERGERGGVDFGKVLDVSNVVDGTWEVAEEDDGESGGAPAAVQSEAPGAGAVHQTQGGLHDGISTEQVKQPAAATTTKTAAPAKSAPVQAAPAKAQGLVFSAYLASADGEMLTTVGNGGHFTDPAKWTSAFCELYGTATTVEREVLVENNASEIEAAQQASAAARMTLDALFAPTSAGQPATAQTGPAAQPDMRTISVLMKENGGADFSGYIIELRGVAATVTADVYEGWRTAQAPTLGKLPTTMRRAADKVMADLRTRLGMDKPSVATTQQPEPPDDAQQPDQQEPPPADEHGNAGSDAWGGDPSEPEPAQHAAEFSPQKMKDLKWAEGTKKDIEACATAEALDEFARNKAVSSRLAEITLRAPDIAADVIDYAAKRRTVLRGQRPAAG